MLFSNESNMAVTPVVAFHQAKMLKNAHEAGPSADVLVLNGAPSTGRLLTTWL